jgi:parvulin-like peptidyl-prolyl isomerase
MAKHLGWILLAAAGTIQAQTSSSDASSSDVVVSRGGITITLQDIDTYVARVPKEHREKFIDSPQRIRDMLNNMMLTKQMAEQARAAHLDQQPEIQSQLRAADDEVLARARMNEFKASIKVPDLTELVREQYLTHKDLYKVPAKTDVYHLLISTEKRSDDEAKALAEKARAEALADPKNFAALVEKYSEDNSKATNKGEMKDATGKAFVQEFREAAGALTRVGEISPVVHTIYGYHVLQLAARSPERQQSFDEVREQLTASVREQYITTQRRDFVNELNNQKLDINSATLDTLRDRYDEAGNVKVATAPAAKGGGTPPATPQKP